MLSWKDHTVYRYGDRNRIPRSLECQLVPGISFSVHRHIHYGEEWLLSCYSLGVESVQLGAYNPEDAKRKGAEFMLDWLRKRTAEMEKAVAILEAEVRG